jgi:hypothetical protein
MLDNDRKLRAPVAELEAPGRLSCRRVAFHGPGLAAPFMPRLRGGGG